jgi:catechol 2,3-dioxygenase-like lactoylglutathione lyase family enzyme
MKLEVEAVNHVCLIVKDLAVAEKFYVDFLGLERHHKASTWYVLGEHSTLHLVEIPEVEVDDSLYHKLQHLALQVPDLRSVFRTLLEGGKEPFQLNEDQPKILTDVNDPLDVGNGSVYTYDPDGNLVEFLQFGRGKFTEDMKPRPSYLHRSP